ncbi:MAG: hypothetical protein NZ914_15125, partial [Gemmatales bacterium]|nr:hypothetical protein [Gemmatales bacterium]
PVYAFHIERENPEDPWLLRKVVLASAEKAFAQFEAQRQGAISGSRQRTNFGAARLPVAVYDLVASSEFTIRRLSGGQHADYEMEVLLENRRPVQANSIVSGYRTITLLLDKRYDYWIRKFCARRQSPRYQWGWWEIHEECEAIASGENVVEIPEIQKTICRIHETQYDAQGRVTGKHATVHESVPQGSQRQREPRDEEFTLSYYGLPEPAGVTWPKPRPWWLYLSLTGLALVVMGLALGTYLRWRRTRLAQISAN